MPSRKKASPEIGLALCWVDMEDRRGTSGGFRFPSALIGRLDLAGLLLIAPGAAVLDASIHRVQVDQAALVGMINYLNGLGLPLVSVECVPARVNAAYPRSDVPRDHPRLCP